MQILIDATPLLLRSAGVKNYTYYWIQSLCEQARNDRILTLPALSRLGPLNHEGSIAGRVSTFWHLGRVFAANRMPALPLIQWTMPKADVFHVSNQIRFPPKKQKLTATIYDMTVRLMPELHTAANIQADESLAKNVLARADRLIAISENSRQDAVRLLGLDASRIEVIYPGVPEVYFGAQARPSDRPYVLYVGTIEPRKNVDTLLDAWESFRRRSDFDLVIAGASGWAGEKTLARLAARPAGVRYLGYVPEDELPGLTAGATAFVYPSLYEGFGFPVAQAMAAGVPVITSNASCLPEVAGEGALLVDPRSASEIRNALEKLVDSPQLQRDLVAAGLARAREQYRWSIAGRKSLEFFHRV
ncbi:MAG TPA: glycosyltransferase family 1 protein [Bryobacteraceae bacterium]|nr:glycosyltransferase family 1 protein [Bryobacteraceae bacterium]